jgi:formiminotetrahydrofolate cyclodeaminase
VSADDLRFRDRRLDELLARISAGPAPPGAGTVAALSGAMAAGLVAMAARGGEAPGAVAQAESLRERLVDLAEEDARALDHALRSLSGEGGGTSTEARDFHLGRALTRAADELVRIAEACESVAELAAFVAAQVTGPVQSDAAAAATIAEACSRVATTLVEVNLATLEGDARLDRARAAASGAAAAASRASER